jgi:hypothetical protein
LRQQCIQLMVSLDGRASLYALNSGHSVRQ